MTVPENFSLFLHSEGKPLAEINPGSWVQALEFLAGTEVAILGGDVLSESSGKLEYTRENWYCERLPEESTPAFANRSRLVARQFIDKLIRRGQKNLRIVLVYTQ